MGILAVLYVDEVHVRKLIAANLKRQGWILAYVDSAIEAIDIIRNEGANLLIVTNNAISPMTFEELSLELGRDPGDDKVKVINLDIKSPQPPSIFSNPKGPLPPAIAVRPMVWLGR